MLPIKIDLPDDFLEEEVRCGYVVTTKMKKVWAVQLDLLAELERVCKKYHLTYYADSGTLIGAIRHNGYIPWDDDIDIVMLRRDYDKLLRIAHKEFRQPYFLQSAYSEKRYVRGYSRLRNSDTTAIVESDVDKEYNCGIFIDIFPLDHIPDNPIVFNIWKKEIVLIKRALKGWAYYGLSSDISFPKNILKKINILLLNKIGYLRAFRFYERTCGLFNSKKTKRLSYIAYSYGKKKHLWECTCFDDLEYKPFEFTEINVPVGYDSRLRVEYGNYMEIRRASSAHGDVIFEPEIPYKQYKKMHSVEEMKLQLK